MCVYTVNRPMCMHMCVPVYAYKHTHMHMLNTPVVHTQPGLRRYLYTRVCVCMHIRVYTYAYTDTLEKTPGPAHHFPARSRALRKREQSMPHVSCRRARQRTPQIQALGARFYGALGERFCEGSGERFCEALGDFDFRCLWGSSPSARARGVF